MDSGEPEVSEELQRAFEAAWERVFTARWVQDAAGLTSRQLNDWDQRGALPHERGAEAGWRRFTAREVFILMTCAELRRQFGVSVDRIRYVQQVMLSEGANHLEAAIQLMSMFGVGVWLLTDFRDTFVMDSELEFADLWEHGFFGAGTPSEDSPERTSGSDHKAFALLKINPIVNQLLGLRKEKVFLSDHGRGYEIMADLRAPFGGVRSPEEYEVLQLIRSGDYERVEILSPEGKIETIRTTSHPDPSIDLDDIRKEYPYQSLTVVQKNGRTVSIEQTRTIKANAKRPTEASAL